MLRKTTLLAALCAALASSTGGLRAQSGSLVVENAAVRISVFADKGALNEIVHKPSGVNLRSRGTGAFRQIWSMNYSSPEGTVQVGPSDTTTFSGAASGSTLDLTWRGLQPAGKTAIPNAVIHATITLSETGAAWNWDAQNLGGVVVQSVFYPIISGIGPLSARDDIFVGPFQEGRLFRNPVANNASFAGTYPSGSNLNMQFMALSSPAVTFAMRAQDAAGYVKAFSFSRSTSPAIDHAMQIQHEFDAVAVDRVSVPYAVVLSAFVGANGDWTDAAEDYKKWAGSQSWVQQARSRSTPGWLLNTAMSKLVVGSGSNLSTSPPQTYEQNASLLSQDQQSLGGGSLLAMFWGWEKYGAWYYGDYFPPIGGWTAFDAGIQAAKQTGNRWHLFISPTYVVNTTDLWKSGSLQSSAMLDATGKMIVDTAEGRPQVWMDHSSAPWQAQIVSDATQLAIHGIDLIQLDGFPWLTPHTCFNAAHGHPPGRGGNWPFQAWRTLLTAVRSSVQAAKADAALSGEGGNELYLPWLDVYHSRDNVFESINSSSSQAGWEVIPLFDYVYHPLITFLGENPFAMTTTLMPDYQMVSLGRTLVWGQLPNYYSPPPGAGRGAVNPTAFSFVQKIAAARTTFARKYVGAGSMLPPPPIQSPTFSAGVVLNQSPGTPMTSKEFPAVQAGAWRAPDGTVGIVLGNTTTNALQIQVPVNFKRLGLDATRPYTACLLRGSGVSALGTAASPDATFGVALGSLDIAVVELTTSPVCQPG